MAVSHCFILKTTIFGRIDKEWLTHSKPSKGTHVLEKWPEIAIGPKCGNRLLRTLQKSYYLYIERTVLYLPDTMEDVDIYI